MINPTNFIKSYSDTDKSIILLTDNGGTIANFNVCNYLACHVVDNKLHIVLKGESGIVLSFSSKANALNGLAELEETVNTLFVNCALVSYEITPPSAAVTLSKSQYMDLVNSNSVVPYTNYIVIDSADDFGEGVLKTFLFQAKTTSDSFVEARFADSNDICILDFLLNKLFIKYSQAKNLISLGNSTVSVIDDLSNNITAENNSQITADSNSSYITAKNNSQLTVDGCTHINATNSIARLSGCDRVTLIDVTGNLSGVVLSDVEISPLSNGKLKIETLSLTNDETIYAYERGMYLIAPELTENISKTLDDRIFQKLETFKVNSRFFITVPSTGLGGFTLTVKNANGDVLDELTDSHRNTMVEYICNDSTGLFERNVNFSTLQVSTNRKYATVDVSTYQQSSFSNIFTTTPSDVYTVQMYVNGVIQCLGVDFTVSGLNINYIGNYKLEVGDKIQVYYS